MTGTIGVVTALPGEARKLAGHPCRQKADGFLYCRTVLKDETDLMVVQSGMGSENAFSAALWLLENGAAALGCFGVSGGLNPRLKPGDVVFADAVLGEQHDDVSLVWKKNGGHLDETFKCLTAKDLPVQWGPIISVQKQVLDAAGKRALFHRTKALAVDMETAAVARAANESGLPFFAVRIICDPVNVSVPKALFRCVDEKGNPRFFYLLKRILQKPSFIIHLLSMKRNFDAALAGAAHVRHCLSEMDDSPAP
jgi:adenosylhomocysteine nucleosidase